MDKRVKVTDDQRTDIIAAALAGEKQASIAARLGLSPMTVSRLVREVTGVNKSRNIDETKRQAVIDAYTDGMLIAHIARLHDTTTTSVRNILNAAGIDSGLNRRVLTPEERQQIQDRYSKGGVSANELAREYGVSRATIDLARKGKKSFRE